MKKIPLLLSLFLFFGFGIAQSQTQKADNLADETKLYPNPAKSTEQVSVSFEQPLVLSTIQLVKIDGWVPGGWSQLQQSQQQTGFRLPKLSSGTYVIKFSLIDGRFFSKKIVIGR